MNGDLQAIDPLELDWQRMPGEGRDWWLRQLGEHAGRAVIAIIMATSDGMWDVTVIQLGPPRGRHHVVVSASGGARSRGLDTAKRIAAVAFRQLERGPARREVAS